MSVCLLLTACSSSGPRRPDRPLPPAAAEAVENFASYAAQLRSQSSAELSSERARLEALPDSADRSLRLTLLYAVQIYADNEQLRKHSEELNSRLTDGEQQRQALAAELETARQQLETERNERERLEKQLKALKSLEAKIKDRDEANSN